MTRLTRSRVIASSACRTLWCSVACAIFMSPKHSIMKTSSSGVPVSRATNDGWPSNGMPAIAIEVSFCGAATTAATLLRQRRFHGGAAERDRRAPGRGAGLPRAGWPPACGQSSTASRAPAAPASSTRPDRMQLGLDAAGEGVALEDCRVADQDRTAGRPHRRVERGLQADLRADAGGVAGRDRDERFVGCHGVFYGPALEDANGASTDGNRQE